MTITVVSPASGGNPLAALTGSTANAGNGDSGFGALFSQILAGKKGIRDINDLLAPGTGEDATLQLAGAAASGSTELLAGALPESMQGLLDSRLTKRDQAPAQEDQTTAPLLFAPLQAQVDDRPAFFLKDGSQGRAARVALDNPETLIPDLPLDLPAGNTPANLAAAQPEPGQLNQPFHTLPGTSPVSNPAQQTTALPEVHSPLHDPRWSQEFGEKIVWMARHDQQQAQLNLNPAHLGPLRITLNMESDQASAVFSATTHEVRQAIEDALPRLREMLASAGISLGQTQVGTQSQHEQQAMAQQGWGSSRARKDEAILEGGSTSVSALLERRGNGMVDLFA